jgi:DNA replication and repair protein RecF
VSLKIAQLAVWKERFSVCPVLLLDDVLSELDGERSGLLMSGIREWQVQTLISTTVAPDMVSKEPVRFFHVRDGMIVQE